jgi:CRISPR-associated endonuclease/helicase Cas3
VLLSSATLSPRLVYSFEVYRNAASISSVIMAASRCCRTRAGGVLRPVDEFSQRQSIAPDNSFRRRAPGLRRGAPPYLVKPRRFEHVVSLPLDPATAAGRSDLPVGTRRGVEPAPVALQPLMRRAASVSFGPIRMANIEPPGSGPGAVPAGAPDGVRIHLCAYHLQFPLLSGLARQLDQAMNRRQPDAVLRCPLSALTRMAKPTIFHRIRR